MHRHSQLKSLRLTKHLNLKPSPRGIPDPSPHVKHYKRMRFCANYTKKCDKSVNMIIKNQIIKI
jgi:hypothetical protein